MSHRPNEMSEDYPSIHCDFQPELDPQLLLNSIVDYAVFGLDSSGKIVSWNPGAEVIYGYSAAEMIGQPMARLYLAEDIQAGKPEQELRLVRGNGRYDCEACGVRHDGSHVWVHTVTTAIRDNQGQVQGFAKVTRDITQQKQAKEQLLYDAFHDPLTRLPNRALFRNRLSHVFELSKRRAEYLFAVIFVDLDRFKIVNDSLGHLIGDQLLVEVASRLKQCLRSGDTIARLGGDEFAILLEDIASSTDAIKIAERIQAIMVSPFCVSEQEIFTTVSMGITLSSLPRDRAEDFLRDADTAMYRAKELGKNRYEIFDQMMHAQTITLLQVENDLRRAIERQELEVYYQPIVLLKTNRIVGFEALLRWHHPARGLITPDEFIPIAEETGLIVPIGYWVLREACRQMQAWQQQFGKYRSLVMNVNLSGRQFAQPDLIEQIKKILRETQFDPRYLKLEVTESVILENATTVSAVMTQLQGMGIRISLDDFGTGYSSLSYLHRFPIDTLKIDRSFIKGVDLGGEKLELVRTIITLAWNLGMDVVAEGVETTKQLAQLKALHCESVQGYFFSKPLDRQAAEALLAHALPGSEGSQ